MAYRPPAPSWRTLLQEARAQLAYAGHSAGRFRHYRANGVTGARCARTACTACGAKLTVREFPGLWGLTYDGTAWQWACRQYRDYRAELARTDGEE
jgi:hypothetical protein